jgi:pimeloyl-ACP methyl ester carboxylesterase
MIGSLELSAGPIDYEDTGGSGPAIVLIHGLVMDGSLWRGVVAELRDEFRCILPTLPLGAHRRPMRADADLSLRGMVRIVAELLEALSLSDVTLCFNDWGGAQLMIDEGLMDRVGRLVLVSCEAFDNYPPGIPGRMAALSGLLPGGISMMRWALLVPAIRRLPFVFGWMTKRGVSTELVREWVRPLAQPEVRRDLRKYMRGARSYRREVLAAERAMASFESPVLVVWASEDRVMPPEHGHRLAALFPAARLVEVADSYTLVPIDQPKLLADELRTFIGSSGARSGRRRAASTQPGSAG